MLKENDKHIYIKHILYQGRCVISDDIFIV